MDIKEYCSFPHGLVGPGQTGVNTVFVLSLAVDRWNKLHQLKTIHRKEDVARYRAECLQKIEGITDIADSLEITINEGRTLGSVEESVGTNNRRVFAQLSHKISLIKRPDINVVSQEHIVNAMSKTMAKRCASRLMELDDDMVLKVWKVFSKHEDARGMMGSLFESYLHKNFRQRIHFIGEQMFRHKQGNHVKYHASFASYTNHPNLQGSTGLMSISFQRALLFSRRNTRRYRCRNMSTINSPAKHKSASTHSSYPISVATYYR